MNFLFIVFTQKQTNFFYKFVSLYTFMNRHTLWPLSHWSSCEINSLMSGSHVYKHHFNCAFSLKIWSSHRWWLHKWLSTWPLFFSFFLVLGKTISHLLLLYLDGYYNNDKVNNNNNSSNDINVNNISIIYVRRNNSKNNPQNWRNEVSGLLIDSLVTKRLWSYLYVDKIPKIKLQSTSTN